MNTQQLESFMAVVENLNFARAAEILNVSQPAVSRQINALENELGTKLFYRTSRIVKLTPSGISFFEDAKIFMTELHIATAKIQRNTKTNVEILTIGCSNEAACLPLASLLKICKERQPHIHPLLRIIPHRSVMNMFLQGEIDLLFDYQDNVSLQEGFCYLELYQTPLCCVISASHPYAQKKTIKEQELYAESIIICDSYALPFKAASLQRRLENHFDLNSIYYCDNMNAMLALIKADYGFGILPQLDMESSEISCIPFHNGDIISCGVYYKKKASNPLVKDFLSILK